MSEQGAKPISLAVTGMGMVTPVGLDAMASSLALHAGIARLAALDEFPPKFYLDAKFVPVEAAGASVGEVAGGHVGVGRLVRLAAPALAEALGQAAIAPKKMSRTPLIQAVSPSGRAGRDDRLEALFPQRLERQLGIPPRQLEFQPVDQGHVGVIAGLATATELLQSRPTDRVIVGGVDSLVEPETLIGLDKTERLKTDKRRDGFLPGEAAAYLVVETPEAAIQAKRPILAALSGISMTREEATVWTKQPCVGTGLAEAIRATIAPLAEKAAEIGVVICDLNGERYRALEWSYAEIRAFADFDVPRRLWHPADCIGDTGCASGGVSIICAIVALQAGFAGTERVLVWSSADDGQRGSLLVSPAASKKGG